MDNACENSRGEQHPDRILVFSRRTDIGVEVPGDTLNVRRELLGKAS